MDIKKHIKKINNVSTLSALAIGFIAGLVVMYLYFQPHLFFQGETAKDWSNLAVENMKTTAEYSQKLSDLNKKYASVSTALQGLLNAPSPTPLVQYVTKQATQPTATTITNWNTLPDWKYLEWQSGTCKTATPADCPYIAPGY